MSGKVCLQPCLGINRPASTVGRQACYLAHELLLTPERSDLGCAPALYAEVEEDVLFIQNDPVIAVESCEKRCANAKPRHRPSPSTRPKPAFGKPFSPILRP